MSNAEQEDKLSGYCKQCGNELPCEEHSKESEGDNDLDPEQKARNKEVRTRREVDGILEDKGLKPLPNRTLSEGLTDLLTTLPGDREYGSDFEQETLKVLESLEETKEGIEGLMQEMKERKVDYDDDPLKLVTATQYLTKNLSRIEKDEVFADYKQNR